MYSLKDIELFCSTRGLKPLIIDTNILLLFFVGAFKKSYLNQCSLTAGKYTPEDFDLLIKIISYFKPEIIITPHILTEVSNQSKNKIKNPYFDNYFSKIIDKLKGYKEHHIALERMLGIEFKTLSTFGFTDMSIMEAARETDAVILTDEGGLFSYSCHKHVPIIKFSYIKTQAFIPSKTGIF